MTRPARVTRGGAALALLLALLATGCGQGPAASPSASPTRVTPAPTAEPSSAPVVDPVAEWVAARLAGMTLAEKAAAVLMVHRAGTDPAVLSGPLEDPGASGLILMGDNIPDPESALAGLTSALVRDPELPPLLAIDQEGATVRRVRSDAFPAAPQLRALPPEASRLAFEQRSALLESLGVTVNFGIVADVTGEPGSFILQRTLGATAGEASPRVAAAVAGEAGRVYSTLKHFPGHGVAPGDSHTSIPESAIGYEEWRSAHAPPFEAGIAAGAELVMFGHLRLGAIDPTPASLSESWHRILREDLGFEGVAVTDDLSMLEHSGEAEFADPVENAVRALAAGNDLLLVVGHLDPQVAVRGIVAAVESGRVSQDRLDEAAARVLTLRRALVP